MNPKAQAICDANNGYQCRTLCPLTEPCKWRHGDTKETIAARMDAAAEKLEEEK